MNRKLRFTILAIICSIIFPASAQVVALKTNMLSDVLLTPDIGVEFGLAPKWSLEANFHGVAWNYGENRFRHWQAIPEARLWLCQKFHGHFFGLHGIVGQYNLGNIGSDFPLLNLKDLAKKRYEGWMAGAGISYGYDWLLSRHWNLEAMIGIGWIHTWSDVYPCAKCGNKIDDNLQRDYFGPTRLALNIEYLF